MEKITFTGFGRNTKKDGFYKLVKPVFRKSNSKKNYYFLSNDIVKLKSCNLNPNRSYVFIGIANPHSLHVLSLLIKYVGIERIIMVDNNQGQIEHLLRLMHLIGQSKDRMDFLESLFCVDFNKKAIEVLKSLDRNLNEIRGAVKRDNYYKVEQLLWQNLIFNRSKFQKRYRLGAKLDDKGLRIVSKTVGGIKEYYATFVCGSLKDYGKWPFTAAFGSGYLQDEESLGNMKRMISSIPIYIIKADLSDVCGKLLLSNRYYPILFWTSNLLSQYFVKQNRRLISVINLLKTYGTNREPNFPEMDIDVIQDMRDQCKFPRAVDNSRKVSNRSLSDHTRTFEEVCKYLTGDENMEIVNVRRWIDQDRGASKLPNTSYMLQDTFNKRQFNKKFTSIFLHILFGHGSSMVDYKKTLIKARSISSNLIIVEHNAASNDFRDTKLGIKKQLINSILGKENKFVEIDGKHSKRRNLLFVYNE